MHFLGFLEGLRGVGNERFEQSAGFSEYLMSLQFVYSQKSFELEAGKVL
jgi:hypothetical protein